MPDRQYKGVGFWSCSRTVSSNGRSNRLESVAPKWHSWADRHVTAGIFNVRHAPTDRVGSRPLKARLVCVIAGFRCPLEIRWSPPCAAGRASRYEITRPRVPSSACSRTLNWPARSGVARRAQEPQTARAHRADDLPEPAASDCARDRGTAPPGQVFGLSPANRERGHETSDSAASGVPRPSSLQLPGGAAGVGPDYRRAALASGSRSHAPLAGSRKSLPH